MFGFGGGGAPPPPFNEMYRLYSMARYPKGSGELAASLENGDKIIMPPDALRRLQFLNVKFPMQFNLASANGMRDTHVGVAEFTAENGRCYVPHWIMSKLGIVEGGMATVRTVSLRKATLVKVQPHLTAFIKLSDPKAV